MFRFQLSTLLAAVACVAVLCFLHQWSRASTSLHPHATRSNASIACVQDVDMSLQLAAHLGKPVELVTLREKDIRPHSAGEDDSDVRPAWVTFAAFVIACLYYWCDSFT